MDPLGQFSMMMKGAWHQLEGLPIGSPSVLEEYCDAGIIISTLVGEEKIAGKLVSQKKPGWDIKCRYTGK